MAFKMKGPTFFNVKKKGYKGASGSAAYQYNSSFKQTDEDLREYLLSEKGMDQVEADQMIADGGISVEDADFLTWYEGPGDTGEETAEATEPTATTEERPAAPPA